MGTIGITEPNAGSDAVAMSMTAALDGDTWVLDGQKRLIDNTSVAQVFLTWAKTDPSADPPHRGVSAFVVERDAPGFEVDTVYHTLGLRGLGVGSYTLDGCRIPAGNLIGEENRGWYYLMRMLEIGRTATASLCVGLAQAALDTAKAYALERRAFGTTLSGIQAIQFKVAEMAVRVDTARMLVYRAARLIDAGDRSDRESSMAKFWAADAAFYVANEALQILGGIGCTDEAPVERYLRDARIFLIGEGTGEIQRLVVARRELEAAAAAPAPAVPAS
ncbi:MAG: acyl-CoA dehydrogenase [Acidimicrobiia bacterium]|nr:acyl-CoA dehydrogenase [Acidimicrobiia bacterium]